MIQYIKNIFFAFSQKKPIAIPKLTEEEIDAFYMSGDKLIVIDNPPFESDPILSFMNESSHQRYAKNTIWTFSSACGNGGDGIYLKERGAISASRVRRATVGEAQKYNSLRTQTPYFLRTGEIRRAFGAVYRSYGLFPTEYILGGFQLIAFYVSLAYQKKGWIKN